jgi:hypothetical protein
MEINKINSGYNLSKDVNPKGGKKTEDKSEVRDKLEISNQAKINHNNDVEKTNLIKERIENKYYDSDEVVSTVAEKVLKEINGK